MPQHGEMQLSNDSDFDTPILIFLLVVNSNLDPSLKRGCIWTLSSQWANKNREKRRGLGQVTIIKFETPANISKTSKATDLKFGTLMHMVNFFKIDQQESVALGDPFPGLRILC